jgi:hypothetical protein
MSGCYQASYLAAWLDPGLTYVEGVLVVDMPGGGFALPHAWNETTDGRVLDGTLLDPLRDDPAVTVTYYPVRRGTDLSFAELNDRGNPADLVALAEERRPVAAPREPLAGRE